MKTILAGSKKWYITAEELELAVRWLEQYDMLDAKCGQRLIISYSNPETIERLDVHEKGETRFWKRHEVLEYQDIPDDVVLLVVSEADGEPSTVVVWEAELEEAEFKRRCQVLKNWSIENYENRKPVEISQLIAYTVTAQCVLDEMDS